jgi:putative copper resistance protein D
MAVNSIGLHLLAVVVWVGGLVALPFATSGETSERASVLVKRYSALALAAFAVTAISGSANALVRLQPDQLFTTTYGLLVVGKIVTLGVLGAFGAYYRLRIIGRLESQKTRTWFGRLALAELVVMGVAMGLAATLSRTGAPDNTNYNQDPTPAEILTIKKMAINRVVDVQGFRSIMSLGSEMDAMLHYSGVVQKLVGLIQENGLKNAIEKFQSGEWEKD